MYDLLSDPLLSLKLRGRLEFHTLPSVLALLSSGAQMDFSGLQAHQHHPWHAFLVQLAALVLDETQAELLTEKAWREGLLRLTSGDSAPWSLIVDDLSRPAFFQPPVPEKSLKDFKGPFGTPGEIDVLIAAKNFDLKIRRISAPRPEHWVFALVTKQTSEGVLGQGNYGIARMNGGLSSRPCVALVPSLDWSVRFKRDVNLWREHRAEIAKEHGYKGALALVWLDPWDGVRKIERKHLHPYFIEVCRRIRLTHTDGVLSAWTLPTKGTRIDNEGRNGHTGDLWTPLYLKKGATTSLTLDEGGFHFRRLQELLFQWRQPPSMTPLEQESWLYASSLCRGQGKTLGYHERTVFIPKHIGLRLADPSARTRLGKRAQAFVDLFSDVAHLILKPTLLAVLQGILDGRVDLRDDRARPWLLQFEEQVDAIFFSHLWESEEDDSVAVGSWKTRLTALATSVRDRALLEIPVSSSRHDEHIKAARARFEAGKSKFLSCA